MAHYWHHRRRNGVSRIHEATGFARGLDETLGTEAGMPSLPDDEIAAAMEGMSDQDRLVLTLFYGLDGCKDGMSDKLIGRVIGRTYGRVQQIRKRALERLRMRMVQA